jgi:hypothetical protein
MVGFWFDGGLFKLPTAVVFWVLLELARRADIPVCQFGQLSSRPVQEHSAEKHGTGKSHAPAGWKTCPTIALRWLAGIIAVVALGLTALHLITPQRVVSERTLALARKFIVPPKEKADFEFLAAKPIWSGQPLKHLLQHAHLANYNRTLVNWKLDDQLYREFVLSLEIDPSPGLTVTLSPSDGERAGVRGIQHGHALFNLQPVSRRATKRRVHVGQDGAGVHAALFAELDHRLCQLACVSFRQHECCAAKLHIKNQGVEAFG